MRAAGETCESGVDVALVFDGVDVTGGGWNGVFVAVAPGGGVDVGTNGVAVAGTGVDVRGGVDVGRLGVDVPGSVGVPVI